ncbi:MAG: BspA family leucine-rich repeat surface protein, partial [Atopobiaceae bacterium]|nr:BspA family leucine-rich repeat surface protein [Atopobiaceae bacterium]
MPSAEQSEVVDTVVLPEEDVQAVAPEDAVQAEDNPVTEEPAVPVEEPTPPVEEPALAEQASIIASGTWGTCPWELTSDGDLRIYPGVGADTDWSESVPWFPWLPYKQYIRRVSTSSGVVAPNNLCGLFMDCYELVEVDGLNLWDTSVTTNFASMFNGCKKLISADLSGLNVKSIESTNCMFENCESLRSVSLQGWDFGNDWDPITSVQMPYMFRNCISLTSINMSGFNTNKVSSMDHFFEECRSLKSIDLSELDAAHCNDLAFMFYYCSSLETIKLPKNLSPQITRGMFRGCQS